MNETISILLLLLGLASVSLLVFLSLRHPKDSSTEIKDALQDAQKKIEQAVTSEIAKNREEMSAVARNDRKEISASIMTGADANARRILDIGDAQKNQLDLFAKQIAGLTD